MACATSLSPIENAKTDRREIVGVVRHFWWTLTSDHPHDAAGQKILDDME
jgi:hypothetical protein